MQLGGKLQRVKILNTELGVGFGDAGSLLSDDLTVACDEGAVKITRLQRAGKQAQSADEFLRGSTIEAVV